MCDDSNVLKSMKKKKKNKNVEMKQATKKRTELHWEKIWRNYVFECCLYLY